MIERLPSSTPSESKASKEFTPKDIERLNEIKRLKNELLKSEVIPQEAKDILSQLDVEEKSKEILETLEARAKEQEIITVNEKTKEVRIGKETTPIFEGPKEKLSWSLEGEQFREQGQTMVEISFKRNDGVEIQPGGAPVGRRTRSEQGDRFLPINEYKKLKKEYPKYLEAVQNL